MKIMAFGSCIIRFLFSNINVQKMYRLRAGDHTKSIPKSKSVMPLTYKLSILSFVV